MGDDRAEVVAAEPVRELEPERGELDAHVRVELLTLDRIEDGVVRAHDLACLLGVVELLAEDVDRPHLPGGIELAHDSDRVFATLAGDVALGDLANDWLRNRWEETDDRAVEEPGHGRRFYGDGLTSLA
jgi:hypothetical protein